MRRHRFFTERFNLRPGSSVKLPDSEINHIKKVLRLKKGDVVYLFNGEKEFKTELSIVSKDVVMGRIVEEYKSAVSEGESQISSTLEITLFQALIRNNNFEFVLEKATEIGVNRIVPFETEYSVVKVNKVEHKVERWNKIALAAAKQSERKDIPWIDTPLKFEDAIVFANENKYDAVFFFTLPRENLNVEIESLKAQIEKYRKTAISASGQIPKHEKGIGKVIKVALFIGPEGGFSPKEHETAEQAVFRIVSLFSNENTILRAETAAISALSIVKYDLG